MAQQTRTRWEILAPVIGSIVVLIGIGVGFLQMTLQQASIGEGQRIAFSQELDILKSQQASIAEGQRIAFSQELDILKSQFEKDFQRRFWEEQLKLYIEATRAAGILASASRDSIEYRSARLEFFTLYWGPMSVVEDQSVLVAMVNFGTRLEAFERDGTLREDLQAAAYRLAITSRNSSKTSWDVELDDLRK